MWPICWTIKYPVDFAIWLKRISLFLNSIFHSLIFPTFRSFKKVSRCINCPICLVAFLGLFIFFSFSLCGYWRLKPTFSIGQKSMSRKNKKFQDVIKKKHFLWLPVGWFYFLMGFGWFYFSLIKLSMKIIQD